MRYLVRIARAALSWCVWHRLDAGHLTGGVPCDEFGGGRCGFQGFTPTHHNTHRPHMALASAAPDKPLPPEVTDLDTFRTRKHDRAGGVIREYQQAA